MPDIPLLVCGLGRCGTSLCMSMLEAGGVPVCGKYPAYEDDCILRDQISAGEILFLYAGKAVKWLDPKLHPRDHLQGMAAIIWLSRDPKEQAKSQLKMMGQGPNRTMRRGMAKNIARDTQAILPRLMARNDGLQIDFAGIIHHPEHAARIIGNFALPFCPSGVFDYAAAAARVIPRSARCAPDMSIEIQQMMNA